MAKDGRGAATALGKPSKVEWAFWFLALALVVRLTIMIRRRSMDDFQSVDGFAALQIGIIGLCYIASLASGRLQKLIPGISRSPIGIVLVYYLFGALSALWSPSQLFSLYRAVEVISQITVVMVALSYSAATMRAERNMIVAIALSMMLSILSYARMQGLTADIMAWHTNQFTVPGMLLFVYALGEIISGVRKEKRLLWIFGGIGLFGMALGTSSASSASALVGIIIAAFLTREKSKTAALFVIIFLFLSIAGVGVIKHYVFYGKSEKKVESLSGRKYLWEGYIDQFSASPLIGHGFAISARIAKHMQATNTHNSAFSVLLGTGLVGMGIVCAAILSFLKAALPAIRRGYPGALGCTAAMLAGLLNSLGVAFLGETYMMSSFSFFCMLAFFCLFVMNGQTGQLTHKPIIFRRKTAPGFP